MYNFLKNINRYFRRYLLHLTNFSVTFICPDNKVHPFSYVTVAVNRLGHAERKLKAKFKRIDKNTFVKFMNLINKVSLGK